MLNFLDGFAAGIFVMPRQETNPKTASAMRIRPETHWLPWSFCDKTAAATVPRMMAMNVPSSRMPLPHESFRSGNSSGSAPYLDGPKNALCVPMRKTPASSKFLFIVHSPVNTNAMMSSSNTFTPSITERLLKRSARKPPAMENKMNGIANK